MKKLIIPVLVSGLILSSCVQKGQENQTMGTIIGGAGGAALGSLFGKGRGKLFGVALGAIAGSVIGSSIGRNMDQTDKLKAEQNAQNTLERSPTNTTTTWHNPDTGYSGTFTPTDTYQTRSGEYCREYQQTISIGGKMQEAYGQACRQPDGSWKIVK